MFYGAYPKAFQHPDPETPINDWVSHKTGGMIRDFLSQGDITDDMVILLLNAVYFEVRADICTVVLFASLVCI